jgi:hypothetical protein
MPDSIPHATMVARLDQAEQLHDFFVAMWLQNPTLAARAGDRIRMLLAPMDQKPATENEPEHSHCPP